MSMVLDLTKDRTTVVVTHRLGGLADLDEILVLQEGRIVERGSHADLVALEGRYASRWRAEHHQRG
jgi:ABC-type transport system involved in Fe-S cluster assembly fused permease/ATPase subunit